MTTKMTNAMALTNAIEVLNSVGGWDDTVLKLEKMLEQTEKKNSNKKPTVTQTLNVKYKEAIYDFMDVGEKYTVSDLIKKCEILGDLSNQKVASLVTQMVNDNILDREIISRKPYFSIHIEY